jgi:TPR repeat protein
MAYDMDEDEKRDTKALVLWLAEAAEHTDNMSEFIGSVLSRLWTGVGLPGSVPMDDYGSIDLAAVEEMRKAMRRWPALDDLAANATEYQARFYTFERSGDVHKVEDAAKAAGFETYPYRRELCVVNPDGGRPSKKADTWP